MRLHFTAIAEPQPGGQWHAHFERSWPGYRAWFLSEGDAERPTYLQGRRALAHHMPELVSTYERLVELAGGSDTAARFLSLYRPPPYLTLARCPRFTRPDPASITVRPAV